MIKAIIFDFCGPIMILDDEAIYKKNEIKHSLDTDSLQDLMDKFWHGANLGEYKDIFDFYKKTKPSIKLTVKELNEIFQEANSTLRIRPEMINYIEKLKKKYKIAILSNFMAGLEKFLKEDLNIHHLFDVVVSSYNLKIGKPDSKIYYYALEKLNVKADEAIFIDDMERNTKAAEALGIKSIVFRDFKQFKKDLSKILK
jgi:putative hydrolase of the HAD superfamily